MQYRIFSSLESSFIAAYYVALYLTPENIRGVWQSLTHFKAKLTQRFTRATAPSHQFVLWASLLLLCCASPAWGQPANSTNVNPNPASTTATL